MVWTRWGDIDGDGQAGFGKGFGAILRVGKVFLSLCLFFPYVWKVFSGTQIPLYLHKRIWAVLRVGTFHGYNHSGEARCPPSRLGKYKVAIVSGC